MRRTFLGRAAVVVAAAALLAPGAEAQSVYGYSAIMVTQGTVVSFSSTEINYTLSYLYDVETDAYPSSAKAQSSLGSPSSFVEAFSTPTIRIGGAGQRSSGT